MSDVSARAQKIKDCIQAIAELGVPQHLQPIAFQYLLGANGEESVSDKTNKASSRSSAGTTHSLREYVSSLNLKTAVSEIPALLYWAMSNEDITSADEKGVVELYRRAGLRPPKNITQSLRDLASKKYGRLEAVAGQPGFVRLSRVGEDFVIHDIIEKSLKKAG